MTRRAGLLLIGIGIVHTLFGVVVGWPALCELARAGVFDAVEPSRPHVTLLFWFLMTGFWFLLFGHLCAWIERTLKRPLPAFVGWELFAVSALGVVLDPDSGWWLILGVAVYLLARSRGATAVARG